MAHNMYGPTGTAATNLNDRYVQFPSAPYVHEAYSPPHVYEPTPTQYVPSHGVTPKHEHYGGHKSNAAMSALTLLAFLFFLNILQQCLKDHMASMSTPPVMIMTGGREGEDASLAKTAEVKMDKSGQAKKPVSQASEPTGRPVASGPQEPAVDRFTKITLAHHDKPREGFPGFVSAMTD